MIKKTQEIKKQGFTMLEVIVSVALLAIIGTSVFIGFKSVNKKEDKKEKIISDIISAADVYYSMNPNLKKELDNNYRYLVLTISDLKNNGLLDNNKELPKEEGKDYTKMVIDGTDSEIGTINYIYPYKTTEPFIANLDYIYIESFEINDFKCNSKLDKIDYMNENYTLTNTSDFKCGIKNISGATDNTNYMNYSGIVSNLNSENNILLYKLIIDGKEIKDEREVYVNPIYDPTFLTKLVGTETEYTCGTWTNKDVKLSFEDNSKSNRNLYFEWKSNKNLIEKEHEKSIVVSKSETYHGTYFLKGILDESKTVSNSNSCEVKIDKNAPRIDIKSNNDVIKVNITDLESGVYGYLKSEETKDINELNKDIFIRGNNFEIEPSLISKKYYIYAIDNAGNITEQEYKVAGEEEYPQITYEPIKNSFSKFKVTVKNINNSDYSIDDIKIQYDYNKDGKDLDKNNIDDETGGRIYKYYNSDFNAGRYNEGYLETFKENFSYDKSYSKNKYNYIDYKSKINSYTCNENECTFEIDMEDAIKFCGSRYFCERIVDSRDLYNLSLNYYIYAKNKQGYYREIKLNSVLNVYEDEYAFSGKWFDYWVWTSGVVGTNKRGDILLFENNRDDKDTYLYYYNTQDSQITEIDRFDYSEWKVHYEYFDNNYVNYSLCTDYKKGKTHYIENYSYEYDINNDNLNELSHSKRKSSKKCSKSFNSVKKEYKTLPYTTMFENYKFLNDYINRLKNWEKQSVTNPTTHRISNLLDNYVFFRNINGVEWNSILTVDTFTNAGHSRSSDDYNKLYFLTEISMKERENNKGQN